MTMLRLAVCLFLLLGSTGFAKDRPNIVLIMADDMGYSDIGCYGGEIATPTLNRLAENGLRLTQFYNTARCCPTRASLLTGLYPHQAGVGHMMSDSGYDGYRGDLNRECLTIAEAVRPAGYRTYMAGKWHVTKDVRPDGDKANWPCQRGFDRFYGTIHGAGSFFDPNSLTRDNTQISPYADPLYQPDTYYYTDAISDHAVTFIKDHQADYRDQPFFMYVAYTAAHWPMHALPEDIRRYRGRYDAGYGPIREERLARMKKLGLVNADCELSPQAEDWNKVRNRQWETRCMEVYAAMVDRMDQGIGRIVQALQASGQLDNTVIVFLQDNGGCAEGLGRQRRQPPQMRPNKPGTPMKPDELQPDMIPRKTRDGWPVRQGEGVMPGPADTYIAYGRGWANVSNTPFREYKHWVHEGGISTPLIVHWPQGLQRKGELESTPGHLIDIMPTCLALAGAEYPSEHNGVKLIPLEGRSLVPIFSGKTIEREALYWEHEGNRAVRVGDWKLVAKGATGPWELYNLAKDRSELHDLAAQEPTRVRIMSAMWHRYAERARVYPLTPYYSRNKNEFSRKKIFRLSGNAVLPRQQAPMVQNRPFSVQIFLENPGRNGVLVAQGGTAHGYAIFVRDGRVVFAVRKNGKLTENTGEPVADATELQVRVKHNTVSATRGDGTTLLNGSLDGLLSEMPADGLQVGRDTGGQVGNYEGEFPFDGRIQRVEIRIDKNTH